MRVRCCVAMALVGTLASVTTALPALLLEQVVPLEPVVPTRDPFYQPPSGFENTKPGTILRWRQLANDEIVVWDKFRQNLLGVYQDALAQPISTVTTLMIPYDAHLDMLLSDETAEDSTGMNCAPSYNLRSMNQFVNKVTSKEMVFMDVVLTRGIPVGALAGKAVLDAVRAVLASEKVTGMQPTARVTLWGYSGGAIASGWAAQLKAEYAPELNIVGAALGGSLVNVNSTLATPIVNGGFAAGMGFAGTYGLTQQYPEFRDYIFSIVRPEKKEAFRALGNKCGVDLMRELKYQRLSDWLTDPAYWYHPIVDMTLHQIKLADLPTPEFPLLSIIHRLAPINDARDLVRNWCSDGGNILFVSDELSNHALLQITGAADAINFHLERLNEKPMAPGCSTRRTFSSMLDPGAPATFGSGLLNLIRAMLHQPIGRPGVLTPLLPLVPHD